MTGRNTRFPYVVDYDFPVNGEPVLNSFPPLSPRIGTLTFMFHRSGAVTLFDTQVSGYGSMLTVLTMLSRLPSDLVDRVREDDGQWDYVRAWNYYDRDLVAVQHWRNMLCFDLPPSITFARWPLTKLWLCAMRPTGEEVFVDQLRCWVQDAQFIDDPAMRGTLLLVRLGLCKRTSRKPTKFVTVLDRLFVAPQHRGQGVARALLEHIPADEPVYQQRRVQVSEVTDQQLGWRPLTRHETFSFFGYAMKFTHVHEAA